MTDDSMINNKAKPPELELNLRPGVQMSPPRATARSAPDLYIKQGDFHLQTIIVKCEIICWIIYAFSLTSNLISHQIV